MPPPQSSHSCTSSLKLHLDELREGSRHGSPAPSSFNPRIPPTPKIPPLSFPSTSTLNNLARLDSGCNSPILNRFPSLGHRDSNDSFRAYGESWPVEYFFPEDMFDPNSLSVVLGDDEARAKEAWVEGAILEGWRLKEVVGGVIKG